ncbi:DUR1 Allophanate hydrolase subunit 2 [Paracoccaceae bacterium]
MTALLTVAFAGPHVTVQDGGRPGLARFGVPRSGAMDRLALAAANLAVGNAPEAAAIEVSLGGLQLDCVDGPVSFAVAGGGFIVEHGGHKGGSWQVTTLQPGERLVIRRGPWGAWCYLAFAGGLVTKPWLGSAATHSQSGFGGGRVVTGDELSVEAPRFVATQALPCPAFARPLTQIAAMLGPQDRFFAPDQIAAFEGAIWRLSGAYDRMGVRLTGPLLPPDAPLDMPSEPVARGSVQVAGDGVATVLLADHQTTGGYPKLATVLDADLDRFAQLRPGDAFRFRLLAADEALSHARMIGGMRTRWLEALGQRS